MKGVSLIQDVFMLLFLLALTVIVCLFIWVLIMTFQVGDKLMPGGLPTTRQVEMTLLYNPITYDAIMSAFLQSEYNGESMDRILNAAVIQEKTTIWLDGKTIDAKQASEDFLGPLIKKDYILRAGNIIIATRGDFANQGTLQIQRTYTNMFLLNGKESYLQLLVVE